MAVNIKFTAQENEVIASLKAMGGETAKLVEENIKLANSYAEADAKLKFFNRGLGKLKQAELDLEAVQQKRMQMQAQAAEKAKLASEKAAIAAERAAERVARAAEKEASAIARAKEKEQTTRLNNISNAAQGLLGYQLSGPLAGVGGALGGGAGLAIGASLDGLLAVGKEVVSVTEKYNRLQIALDSATGSANMGARSMAFIVDLAGKTGQRIEVLAGSYKTLAANARGTVLEGAGVEKIFTAITKAGSAMQLSNEQIKGSLKAIGDMMNKGKIQAEELTQQFSENFPGGAKLFADALGISTAELFKLGEQGKLIASEVLPKVADYLEKISKEEYAKNLDTITGSANRMRNEFDLFLVDIGRSSDINTFFAAVNNGLADTLKGIRGLVASDEWASFMGLFSGNPVLVTAGLAKGSIMTGKSEMQKFKDSDRERQQQLIKVQKAIVESAANQFALDMPGKFKYDPEGAKRAVNDLAKQGKILTDMLAALKAPSPKLATAVDPKNKQAEENKFAKEIRRQAEESKDIAATSLAAIKTATIDLKIQELATEAAKTSGLMTTRSGPVRDTKGGFPLGDNLDLNDKLNKQLGLQSLQDDINKRIGQIIIDPNKIQIAPTGGIYNSLLESMSAGTDSFAANVTNMISGAMVNVVTDGFQSIGNALANRENPFKAFGQSTVSYLGDMMTQMGATILSTALPVMLGLTAATGGLTAGMAAKLAAAGAGMLATGGALRAVKFAKGGIVSGPTYSMTGEYPNARNNPEVIAPLSRLSQLFQPYFQKAINLSGGGQNYAMQPVYLNPTVYLDGKVLATQMQKVYIQKGRTN